MYSQINHYFHGLPLTNMILLLSNQCMILFVKCFMLDVFVPHNMFFIVYQNVIAQAVNLFLLSMHIASNQYHTICIFLEKILKKHVYSISDVHHANCIKHVPFYRQLARFRRSCTRPYWEGWMPGPVGEVSINIFFVHIHIYILTEIKYQTDLSHF